LTDDANAVVAGIWTDNAYVDTSIANGFDNWSMGLLPDGNDNNLVSDWVIFLGSSYGNSNSNGSEIPEFSTLYIPIIAVIFFTILIKKRKRF
jgi:hypothetical protein